MPGCGVSRSHEHLVAHGDRYAVGRVGTGGVGKATVQVRAVLTPLMRIVRVRVVTPPGATLEYVELRERTRNRHDAAEGGGGVGITTQSVEGIRGVVIGPVRDGNTAKEDLGACRRVGDRRIEVLNRSGANSAGRSVAPHEILIPRSRRRAR